MVLRAPGAGLFVCTLTCPDDTIIVLPAGVRLLVFVDDELTSEALPLLGPLELLEIAQLVPRV